MIDSCMLFFMRCFYKMGMVFFIKDLNIFWLRRVLYMVVE